MATRLQADTRRCKQRIEDATRELIAQKDAAEAARPRQSRASSPRPATTCASRCMPSACSPRPCSGVPQGAEPREPSCATWRKAVSAMERLFDSLLDISKLDAGTLRAQPRPFRLDGLFTQLLRGICGCSSRESICGCTFVRPRAVVVTDELLLHRLLSNLVANAIRYTERRARS